MLATTTTANGPRRHSGSYLFSQIACTTYKVRVAASNFATGQPLEGKFPTTPFAGGDPALDSNGDSTSTSKAVLLPNGVTNLTIDFGYLCPVQICPDFGGTSSPAST